ncbi:MAG: hypothetical protein IJ272_08850 [Clostridia bacterium]|nr:hypothetical protein [Clostridia bacterium]
MNHLNAIEFPNIDDKEIDNMKLVGQIEFLSDDQNKQIFEDVKRRLKNLKNDKFYTLEEVDKHIKEQFGF